MADQNIFCKHTFLRKILKFVEQKNPKNIRKKSVPNFNLADISVPNSSLTGYIPSILWQRKGRELTASSTTSGRLGSPSGFVTESRAYCNVNRNKKFKLIYAKRTHSFFLNFILLFNLLKLSQLRNNFGIRDCGF